MGVVALYACALDIGLYASAGLVTMATFRLTYLHYRGRAELIRFILSQAGIQFEDIRLPPEKWNEIRPGLLG